MTCLFHATKKVDPYAESLDAFLRRYLKIQFPISSIYGFVPTSSAQHADLPAINNQTFHSACCFVYPHMIEGLNKEFRKNGELIEFGVMLKGGGYRPILTASAADEYAGKKLGHQFLWEVAQAGAEVINLFFQKNELPMLVDLEQQLRDTVQKIKSTVLMSDGPEVYKMRLIHDETLLSIELNERTMASFNFTHKGEQIPAIIKDINRLVQLAALSPLTPTPIQVDVLDYSASPSLYEETDESLGAAMGA
jgi:hypothetical protein